VSRSAFTVSGHLQTMVPLSAAGTGLGHVPFEGLVLGLGETAGGMLRTGCGSVLGCADVGSVLLLGSMED
jgi:hypothetical protein